MTTTVGIIGCGYWGPNLIRNFVSCPETELLWACDLDENRLKEVLRPYPNVRKTTNMNEMLADESVAAIAIATPVDSHYHLAKACLEHGKHILLEKPLATNVKHGEELVKLAKEKNLQLMCDHTFCYTGAVRKIKVLILSENILALCLNNYELISNTNKAG
jgi:predicted dehydrogenase